MTDISIADHGLIGDLQTAALVSTDGSVDWLCCPRFDSPSVFGGLLDPRGGHFRIHPAVPGSRVRQVYLPDTAVLITRFLTQAGVGEVVDFMPPADGAATDHHRLVRMVRCVRGRMRFAVELAPRFDYGHSPHFVHRTEHGAVFTTDALTLTLHPVREPDDPRLLTDVGLHDGDVHASIALTAGDVRGVVLEFGAGGPPREIRVAEVHRLFDDTVAYWRSWLARSTYTGRWRETVQRSAITLKLSGTVTSLSAPAADPPALEDELAADPPEPEDAPPPAVHPATSNATSTAGSVIRRDQHRPERTGSCCAGANTRRAESCGAIPASSRSARPRQAPEMSRPGRMAAAS